MGRTVHLRLSDRTIAACYDVLKGTGYPMEGITIGPTVARALMAMINGLIKQGRVQTRTEEQALQYLKEKFPPDPRIIISEMPLPSVGEEEGRVSEEELQQITEGMKGVAEEVLHRMETGGHVEDVPVDRLPPSKVSTSSLEIPLGDLERMAPMDRLVSHIKREGTEYSKRALSIVYANLDRSLWGTDKASSMVASVAMQLEAQEVRSNGSPEEDDEEGGV